MHSKSARRLQLGILASGSGSNLQSIIDAISRGKIKADIAVVISDRVDAFALVRAEKAAIESIFVDPSLFASRDAFDAYVAGLLEERGVGLVVLAGYMRIVGNEFLGVFEGRTINTHPALLPAFPGMHAIEQALAYGVRVTGCTVHFIDNGVDTGPIIAQKAVKVKKGDDADSLRARIQIQEHRLYPKVIGRIADGRISLQKMEDTMTSKKKNENIPVRKRRALISVWDKKDVVEFAKGLIAAEYEVVSSGGTSKVLEKAGISHVKVEDITGFGEMLGGRVKTLHPMIHGGILANRSDAHHMQELDSMGIVPIDIIAVNLYPFREAVAAPGAGIAEAIEHIDIGGSALIRAAAKNHMHTAVVVDPAQYGRIIGELREDGVVSQEARCELAVEAFRHSSAYDASITSWFAEKYGMADDFPQSQVIELRKVQDLRYGENPAQAAAFYATGSFNSGLAAAAQLQGKELSYNNILDMDAATNLVAEFDKPAAVIIKHTNPCGVAAAQSVNIAFDNARKADPLSAYGGIVAVNREINEDCAKAIVETFFEVICAPSFSAGALQVLTAKKSLRLMVVNIAGIQSDILYKSVSGGMLVQSADQGIASREAWELKVGSELTDAMRDDLDIAWKIVKHTKSNGIVLVKDSVAVGVGAGQMSRIESVNIAIGKAGDKAVGAVAVSDAFFPFADSIESLAAAKVAVIAEPGGSVRDAEVIAKAEELGVALVFTGRRHFKH